MMRHPYLCWHNCGSYLKLLHIEKKKILLHSNLFGEAKNKNPPLGKFPNIFESQSFHFHEKTALISEFL